MANGTQPEPKPDLQRRELLTEYEVCQRHNDAIGSQGWVATTIFLTINVTLLGGLFYTVITRIVLENPNLASSSFKLRLATLISFIALSVGIILILWKWVNWLKRMRFRTQVNFQRMGEIEKFLGMKRHTMCHELDNDYDQLKTSAERKAFEKEQRKKHFDYFKASGFHGLIYIARILMGLWAFSILVLLFVLIISP